MEEKTEKNFLINLKDNISVDDDFDQLSTYLFIFSLFFYPFVAVSHSIYLVPQLLLCANCLVRLLTRKNNSDNSVHGFGYLIYLNLLFFVLWSASVEILSDDSYYDFPLKMALNTATVALVAGTYIKLDFRKILAAMPLLALAWLSVTMFIYSSSDNILASLLGLFARDSLDSSDLYGIASPLETVFLTKNITAIFFVACLAIYLCSARIVENKISIFVVILFVALVLSFLSRQATLAILVIFFIYFLTSKKIRAFYKFTATLFASFCAVVFLMLFFNFDNPNDGANERVLLWQNFSHSYYEFFWTGIGYNALKEKLVLEIGIDNYHTFLMNQISTYGVFFFFSFNFFILEVFRHSRMPRTSSVILGAAYFLNVSFQTFGFEYQNTCLLLLVSTHFGAAPSFLKKSHA